MVNLLAGAALVGVLCTAPAPPERPCRERDSQGRLERSYSAKADFLECVTGDRRFPLAREGYRVEHLIPLACGGADTVANMALLPVETWAWKRGWEREDCAQTRELFLSLGLGEVCPVETYRPEDPSYETQTRR